MKIKDNNKTKISFVLGFCLIMGLILRLWAINFGLPFFSHIDEEHYLPRALRILRSQDLNPHYFRNPPLLTYLYSIVLFLYFVFGKLIGWFTSMRDFVELYFSNMTSFFVIARTLNALFGVGICLVVYKVGKKLFDKITGLIASILVCSSFLMVRDSHYAVNDIPGTFFLILSFSYIVSIYTQGRLKDYILSGLFAGMAVATKYNMGIIIFPLVLSHFFANRGIVFNRNFICAGLSCLIGFFLFCPWILLDYRTFWEQFAEQFMFSKRPWPGASSTPSYIQYFFTLLWGYGLLPFCFFIIGSIFLSREKEKQKLLLILCCPLFYYLPLGAMKLFFVRFVIPLIPYLSILSAYGIISLAGRISYKHRRVALVLLILVSISQGVIFSCKHNYLISKTNTRIIARNWINNNLPHGSKIVTEGYGPSLRVYYDKGRFMQNINNYQVEEVGKKLSKSSLNEYKQQDINYIITSSYISRRYLDRPDEYPRENEFYITLEKEANQIFKISPSQGKVPFYLDEVYSPFWNIFVLDKPGPTITIFQIH
ncbi:MAG: glycosyltransferase family 39 protein [Candidatus Poribacteria bacterium]|nr:glycosyltransferase family 39 protein [Candidatus Poribacteria bacterium]